MRARPNKPRPSERPVYLDDRYATALTDVETAMRAVRFLAQRHLTCLPTEAMRAKARKMLGELRLMHVQITKLNEATRDDPDPFALIDLAHVNLHLPKNEELAP